MKLKLVVIVALTGILAACGSDTGFKLDGEQTVFQQSVTRTQVKVDILWVVDNSGSMQTSQQNVAANFQSFIDKFQSTNFDYRMAVTATDAYRANLVSDPTQAYQLARFRDGTDATSHTGVTVIDPTTPDLETTFVTNILQGTNGSGDERGMQSLETALELQDNKNEPFPRQDALLAIIVLTDEEDGSVNNGQYYQDYLAALTNSTPENLNYMINIVGILDETCLGQLNTTFTGRQISQSYMDLADATGGYKGSLCDDFTDVMSGISDSIIEKSTAFKLNREPALDTMVVTVDGVLIPMDPINGWTYDSATMLVSFHGTSVPGSEAIVSIVFDPLGLK